MPEKDIRQCQCLNCEQSREHPDKELHYQMNLFLSRLDEQHQRWYVDLEDETAGDPMSDKNWVRSTVRQLSQVLCMVGYQIGRTTVRRLLKKLNYSLKGNRKQLTGLLHPDRDRQFRYIEWVKNIFLATGYPVISVDALSMWWELEDRPTFPDESKLLILSDAGGNDGCRPRLWKQQLQKQLADRLGIEVMVCHYPTGASKWNPIEHRLFSYISLNWAGKPLRSFETVLGYIRDTTTETGPSQSFLVRPRVPEEDQSLRQRDGCAKPGAA